MTLMHAIRLLAISAIMAEANNSMRRAPKDLDMKALQVKKVVSAKLDKQAKISPELEPSSSQKFMKKDLPFDKRPKADPFHFNHPYPVVQDSGDFDRDFIKDENSDNGNWKAQETYDRLRAKLAKEKRDLARALARQNKADKELEEAMKKHDAKAREADKARHAAKDLARQHADEKRRAEEERARRAKQAAEEEKEGPIAKQTGEAAGKKTPEEKAPAPIDGPDGKDIDAATQKTKAAVDNLEDCKKQLAAARERLKKLMEELEAAKQAQSQADAAVDAASSKELDAETHRDGLKKEVQDEYADYLAAKKAYEEQLDLIAKLEADIKVAAAKVKAMRDAEDRGGGVYNTPEERSGAVVAATSKLLALALVGLVATL